MAYAYLPYINAAQFFAAGVDLNLNVEVSDLPMLAPSALRLTVRALPSTATSNADTSEVSDLGKYKDFGPSPKWRHMLT